MNDGPSKNLNLAAHHRKAVDMLADDAFSEKECKEQIYHAMMQDLHKSGDLLLVKDLQDLLNKKQPALDIISDVKQVFERHNKTPFADNLQKAILHKLDHELSLKDSLKRGLSKAIEHKIRAFINQIKDWFMEAKENGDATTEKVENSKVRLFRVREIVSIEEICDALQSGDKNTFKRKIVKKSGADEGPSL